jgi:hypothetical protein
MKKRITAAILVQLLLTAQTPAPSEPDEATKIRALKLGYALNGNSMVRAPHLGSIDLRTLLLVPDATLIEPPPVEAKDAPTVAQPRK